MGSLTYKQEIVHPEAIARFGELELTHATYQMPCVAPGLRTGQDVAALAANMADGGHPEAITPYASARKIVAPALMNLFSAGGIVQTKRPLVVPDIESEALSVGCTARLNYEKLAGVSTAVSYLMRTGLTGDAKKNRAEYSAMWKWVERQFGFSTIVAWQTNHLVALGSDVMLVPTPLVRADPASAAYAFHVGKAMVAEARASPRFMLHGIHLLVHAEIFGTTSSARLTRQAIVREIESWLGDRNGQLQGLVVSFKIYDPSGLLTDAGSGNVSRRNLSEFVSNIQAATAAARGLLVAHNLGPWALGLLDSGADIVTARADGKMRIDTPMTNGGKPGPRATPMIYGSRSLGSITADEAKIAYERTGAFPVPSCVPPKPYWTMKWSEANVYAHRTQFGVLVELGHEYRDAGLDAAIMLSEAVRSRVRDSAQKQALSDLCPSIW